MLVPECFALGSVWVRMVITDLLSVQFFVRGSNSSVHDGRNDWYSWKTVKKYDNYKNHYSGDVKKKKKKKRRKRSKHSVSTHSTPPPPPPTPLPPTKLHCFNRFQTPRVTTITAWTRKAGQRLPPCSVSKRFLKQHKKNNNKKTANI